MSIDMMNVKVSTYFDLMAQIEQLQAEAEKYAKILAKTIISPDGDSGSYGQNAFLVRP